MFDRTAEFGQAAKSTPPHTRIEITDDQVLKSSPMDDYLRQVEEVKREMGEIQSLMKEIETFYKQGLLVVGAEESKQFSVKVKTKSGLATQKASLIRGILIQMSQELSGERQGRKDEFDLKIKKSQYQSLGKKFLALMREFEEMQVKYREKYRLQLQRQYLLVNPEATKQELESLEEGEVGASKIFSLTTRAQAQRTLTEMQQRRLEMSQIETSTKEIHQMMLDAAILVKQQGEMIDRVEQFVDQVEQDVQTASSQVEKGIEKHKLKQKLKWIFSSVFVIILVGLVIILTIWLAGVLKG